MKKLAKIFVLMAFLITNFQMPLAHATLAAPAFTLSSGSGDATMRSSYSGYTISSTGGAVDSWSIAPSLNNGLTFSTTTGLISGIPTIAQGRTTYTITAHNTTGDASQTFGLLIYAPLIDVQSASPSSSYFGSLVTLSGVNLDVATAGSIAYTDPSTHDEYSASISSLISQSATRVSFYLPAQGTFTKMRMFPFFLSYNQIVPIGLTWRVSLSQTGLNTQNQSEATLVINSVPPTPTILAPASNVAINGIVGSPLSLAFSMIGTAPFFVTASGALPGGLSMTSAGLISGTPTTAGTSTLNFTVQDSLFGPAASVSGISFVIAPAPTPIPDPLQLSKITSISTSTGIAGESTPIVIQGKFIEKVSAIQINGIGITSGSWVQTPTSLTFNVPAKAVGTYAIQIFNGSAPVLSEQSLIIAAPSSQNSAPKKTSKAKVIYIQCKKAGRGTRVVYGTNPLCPAGYLKK